MHRPRPGIANADRPRGGPFATLLGQIQRDSEALDAFGFAYVELPEPARRELVRAVVQDVDAPAPALGALLALEPSLDLAEEITRLLRQHGSAEPFTTLDDRREQGEASLVRPLLGFATERMHIVWNRNEIESIEIEPMTAESSLITEKAPTDDTIAVVAPKLWRYLRAGGALPEGASRFAGFFSIL